MTPSGPVTPNDPASFEPVSVSIRTSDRLIGQFARLTGDVSSLHVDPEFARRSAFRERVAHGMLPLAFLPLLAPLRIPGRQCFPVELSARFTEPLFANETVVLTLRMVAGGSPSDHVAFQYGVYREGGNTAVTEGSLTVQYRPVSAATSPPADTEVGLVMEQLTPRDYLLEDIEVGEAEEAIRFRVSGGAVGTYLSLLEQGVSAPSQVPADIQERFHLPTLLPMLLVSTSVGVVLPGRSATFLEASLTASGEVVPDVDYQLSAAVTRRSRATRIVKKAVRIGPLAADETGAVIEGKVSALVNAPARRMPSAAELRDTGLDLGLRGKVVLVTGASRGIGETIAKLFAVSGARVIVNFHRGEIDAQQVVSDITSLGGEATAVAADVRDRDQVRALVAAAAARFGGIDVLVNNAARDFRPIPFARLDWDDIQADLDVIAKGTFLCCQEVIPGMLERGGGRIVNITSVATELPPPDQLKYTMAKSAVVGLTRSLAAEFASRNVLVNMVVPSFVETDFVAHIQEGFRSRIADDTPMKRLASSTEVAQAVLFLASRYSSFTTGQKIMVTGGGAPFL